MQKYYRFVSSLLLLIVLITFSQHSNTYAQSTLEEARDIVEEYYVGTINGDIYSAQTIDELADMLDIYSDYYTYDEYLKLTNTIEQKNIGIGVVIEKAEEGILIVQVIENGSAYNAHIEVGDIILEVNGASLKDLSTDEASALILGTEGTSVTLKVKKANTTVETKTLTRKAFTMPIVTSDLLYGNIGYIYVSSFSLNAANDVMSAAKKLQQSGASSFIIDLQNNTGGYVSTAKQMISLFPNTKYAYIEKSNFGIYNIKISNLGYQLPGTSRLLINHYSASASEMVAASLKDQNAAILYGETSYGKGVMQGFFQLSDGGILKLTEAEFTGPKNTVINHVGVTPDINTTDAAIYQAHLDAIIEHYPDYKKLNDFKNIESTKTFHITFTKNVATTIPQDAIELVELGGSTVATKITRSGSELIVSPIKPLNKGGHYTLFIHPDKFGTERNILLRKGYYIPITVSK